MPVKLATPEFQDRIGHMLNDACPSLLTCYSSLFHSSELYFSLTPLTPFNHPYPSLCLTLLNVGIIIVKGPSESPIFKRIIFSLTGHQPWQGNPRHNMEVYIVYDTRKKKKLHSRRVSPALPLGKSSGSEKKYPFGWLSIAELARQLRRRLCRPSILFLHLCRLRKRLNLGCKRHERHNQHQQWSCPGRNPIPGLCFLKNSCEVWHAKIFERFRLLCLSMLNFLLVKRYDHSCSTRRKLKFHIVCQNTQAKYDR